MSKSIGVLGCGWLGFPLAEKLVKHGYKVYGSTTSTDKLSVLKKAGIHAFEVGLQADKISGDIDAFLEGIDILFINIPPRLRKANATSYVDKIALLHAKIKEHTVQNIIFASSTSVYGNLEGEITEESTPKPITKSGRQLLICEAMLQNDTQLKTTIIRFGGLIGPTRHPVTTLSKKSGLTHGNDPINLIHLDDCIHIISTILSNGYWNETFNAVYPYHPPKHEYYAQEALKKGLPVPVYDVSLQKSIRGIILSKNFSDKSHEFYTSIVS